MVSIDAVLADELPECAPMFVGDPGSLRNITLGKREHLLNVAPFKIHNESLFGILKRFERRYLWKPYIAGIDRPLLQMRYGALDHVRQLPHIARPIIKKELLHGSQRKAVDAFVGLMQMRSQEVSGQKRDVFAPLP
ncbi:MAG: hypothetical protein WAN11_16055 [Syntrophobacteraceae bacterium]